MELTHDEKILVQFLLEKHLHEFRKGEINEDIPLDIFKAQKEYELFVENVLKRIEKS